MSKRQTRNKTSCPVLGHPKKFSELVLPTHRDVILLFLWEKFELGHSKAPLKDVGPKIVSELKRIWKKASIPVLSDLRITDKIFQYHEKYRKIVKRHQSRGSDSEIVKTVDKFRSESDRLFDISCCKCEDIYSCACPKEKKVPEREKWFLLDQRNEREGIIGQVDKKTTKLLQKREKRRTKSTPSQKHSFSISEISSAVKNTLEAIQSASDSPSDAGSSPKDIFQPPDSKRPKKTEQMRLSLPSTSKMADVYGVSDREMAHLANTLMEDIGIVSKDDSSMLISRSKVKRERSKVRSQMKTVAQSQDIKLEFLFFDGRKDFTKILERIGDKSHPRTIQEEHISILQEPGSRFLGFSTPTKSTSEGILQSICSFLKSHNISSLNLLGIGCDGTNVNTGAHRGIIRRMEELLNRVLQWIICMLHLNELPLHHVIRAIDGPSKGPKEYGGPIGKQLAECHTLPIKDFTPVPCDSLPTVDLEVLSTDQKYFYEIVNAVRNGFCPESLANRLPGKMSHVRWLTTACRILRLYIATETASDELQTLVSFIMNIYAQMWFTIKTSPSCILGSKHFFKYVVLIRNQPQKIQDIVKPVLQNNGYYAHPENILLAMIMDEDQTIRRRALTEIKKCRKQKNVALRKFQVPPINFAAESYPELFDWDKVKITAPPILQFTSTTDLEDFVGRNKPLSVNCKDVPCHTQSVERAVQLVTNASINCFPNEREGYILSKLEGRQLKQAFQKKSAYRHKR